MYDEHRSKPDVLLPDATFWFYNTLNERVWSYIPSARK